MEIGLKKIFYIQGVLALVIVALNIIDIIGVYQRFNESIAINILIPAVPFFAMCISVIFLSFLKWRLSFVFSSILVISNFPSMYSTFATISNWSLWKVNELGLLGMINSLSFPGEIGCIVNSIFLGVVVIGLFVLRREPDDKASVGDA